MSNMMSDEDKKKKGEILDRILGKTKLEAEIEKIDAAQDVPTMEYVVKLHGKAICWTTSQRQANEIAMFAKASGIFAGFAMMSLVDELNSDLANGLFGDDEKKEATDGV